MLGRLPVTPVIDRRTGAVRLVLALGILLSHLGAVGCAPVVSGGQLHLGRTVLVRQLAPSSRNDGLLEGIPLKRKIPHAVRAYLVEGDCGADPPPKVPGQDCRVRVEDLGVVSLPEESPSSLIQYQGGLTGADLAITVNPDSSLRSLTVAETGGGRFLQIRYAGGDILAPEPDP